MLPAALQQPPPLQLFPAHEDVTQQPVEPTAAAQSAADDVASCAIWQP